jgi:uncharacterized membrane protein
MCGFIRRGNEFTLFEPLLIPLIGLEDRRPKTGDRRIPMIFSLRLVLTSKGKVVEFRYFKLKWFGDLIKSL